MTTNTSSRRFSIVAEQSVDPTVEQLSLLPTDQVSARFRLSKDTRERGLRHVAEIRQMLAQRANGAASASPNRAA